MIFGIEKNIIIYNNRKMADSYYDPADFTEVLEKLLNGARNLEPVFLIYYGKVFGRRIKCQGNPDRLASGTVVKWSIV